MNRSSARKAGWFAYTSKPETIDRRARSGLPMTDVVSSRRRWTKGACHRQFSWTKNGVRVRRNARTMSAASRYEAARGFWQMQAMRARAHSRDSGLCPPTSVTMSTKSGRISSSSCAGSSNAAGMAKVCARASAFFRVRL